MRPTTLFAIAGLLLLSACGPIGPVPGMMLGGTVQAAPDDFTFANDRAAHDLVQIETEMWGSIPQVHNIWGVGVGPAMYVFGDEEGGWRPRAVEAGQVRLRIGDAVFEFSVAEMQEAPEDELQAVFDAYAAKYNPEFDEIVAETLGRKPEVDDLRIALRLTSK